MAVVSFEVSEEIKKKKKMEMYKNRINWPEELRKFVEEKIRELESETMREVAEELRKMPFETPRGYAAALIREDRDSN